MSGESVIHVNEGTFDAEILQSQTPALVDFWAPWCGPCRMIAPKLEELAQEYEGKIIVAKVNVDDSPMVPGQLGVRSIPTLLFVKGGKIIDQVIGNVPKSELESRIKTMI